MWSAIATIAAAAIGLIGRWLGGGSGGDSKQCAGDREVGQLRQRDATTARILASSTMPTWLARRRARKPPAGATIPMTSMHRRDRSTRPFSAILAGLALDILWLDGVVFGRCRGASARPPAVKRADNRLSCVEAGTDRRRQGLCRGLQLGLEGIVSKRIDSPCRSGRSDTWLKCRCAVVETVTVIGFSGEGRARPIPAELSAASPPATSTSSRFCSGRWSSLSRPCCRSDRALPSCRAGWSDIPTVGSRPAA